MGTFTWIIIMIVVFWIISGISSQLKKQTRQNSQAPSGNGTAPVHTSHQSTRMQSSDNRQDERYAPVDTGSEGSTTVPAATAKGKEATSVRNGEDEGSPYAKDDTTPYERYNRTPYQTETSTPYEKERQKPYQENSEQKHHIPDFSHLSKEQWTQGVILSEVLGPPRARRPRRTGRTTHR